MQVQGVLADRISYYQGDDADMEEKLREVGIKIFDKIGLDAPVSLSP